jgi:signal transduction histidine kinase
MQGVTRTAHQISETDLSRRIPVTGDDEVAELARTFNEMLDRLEAAFATQRRFLDDAGHDLRTPITIIRGQLELLPEEPSARDETIALCLDELDRMARIVNDLLTLAKAERPDFLRFEPIDLATLTEEVHAKASALGLRDWQLAGVGRGIIVGDRQRLTQAMMQLAQNAVQHTTSGARIELGSRLQRAEASLWVADAGEGIRPDELDRIFDRFARAQQRRASDGAGLGLSIVQAIVDAHHGRIEPAPRSDSVDRSRARRELARGGRHPDRQDHGSRTGLEGQRRQPRHGHHA